MKKGDALRILFRNAGCNVPHHPGRREAQPTDSGRFRNVRSGRYRAAMSEAYSVYWPQQRRRRAAAICQRLAVTVRRITQLRARLPAGHRAPRRPAYPVGVCDQVRMCSARCASRKSSRSATTRHCWRNTSLVQCLVVPGTDLYHRGRHRLRGHQHPFSWSSAGRRRDWWLASW